jgi:signal transduction histidine kinase
VVMIVQEAVNNAIKHAGAPAIKITSSLQNKVWQISIADNGNGFNEKEAAAKTDSYGLTNMKERAAAANISLHINSSAQNGTAIQLQIV